MLVFSHAPFLSYDSYKTSSFLHFCFSEKVKNPGLQIILKKMAGSRVLQELKKNSIVLFLTDSRTYMKTNFTVLKFLCNTNDFAGIYVTSNRPYSSLLTHLEKNKVNMERMFFIDLVTQSSTGRSEKAKNCLFMESPRALTELSIALSQAVGAIHIEEKYVFLDSLSTLLIYNDASTVARFIHFLTGKMRQWDVKGVVISLEKETSPELLSQLSQFVDKVVRVYN